MEILGRKRRSIFLDDSRHISSTLVRRESDERRFHWRRTLCLQHSHSSGWSMSSSGS